jgi:tetratricopeptide (TPR) repeat protein
MNLNDLFQRATQFYQQGELPQAQALCQQLVKNQTDFADAWYLLGVISLQRNHTEDAIHQLARAVSLNSEHPDYFRQLGHALRKAGMLSQALEAYRHVTQLQPDSVAAHHNLAKALFDAGQLEAATGAFYMALRLEPDNASLAYQLASTYLEMAQYEAAVHYFEQALSYRPVYPQARMGIGVVLARQEKWDEAIACLAAVQQQHPELAAVATHLGDCYANRGDWKQALKHYEKVYALQPRSAAACVPLAQALMLTGQRESAHQYITRALRLEPTYAPAWRMQGTLALYASDWPQAAESYTRAYCLSRGEPWNRTDGSYQPSEPGESVSLPAQVSAHKLRHDAQQLAWLEARQRVPSGMPASSSLYQVVLETLVAKHTGPGPYPLNPELREQLQPVWARPVYYSPPPAREGTPLQPLDRETLEATYRERGMVTVDQLLHPVALAAVREFCLSSTFWQDYYPHGGYVGAFLDDGFCSPLLLQLAYHLRDALPGVFGSHPLTYLWAFSCDAQSEGIALHADKAAVNVNFWITPDEANLDPDHGGLVIYDVPAPPDWDYRRYNKREHMGEMEQMLAAKQAQSYTVPYRQNRAVIFDSSLFHRTDTLQFAPGFGSRRINITLLFGERAETRGKDTYR